MVSCVVCFLCPFLCSVCVFLCSCVVFVCVLPPFLFVSGLCFSTLILSWTGCPGFGRQQVFFGELQIYPLCELIMDSASLSFIQIYFLYDSLLHRYHL